MFKKDIEGTFWDGIELNNLTKEGGVKFENGKKPLSLIKRIISMYPYKDISILDFFRRFRNNRSCGGRFK